MKKTCAILIIDPFISPAYAAQRFHELGYRTICLQTIQPPNDYLSIVPSLFDHHIMSKSDIEQDLNTLASLKKRYPIVHGIPGLTATLPYAEALLNHLFPNESNNPNTTSWRSNKYEMNEQLARHHMNAIKQQLIKTSCEINEQCNIAFDFFDQHQGAIVIKPNAGSAGSFGVLSPLNKNQIKDYLLENTRQMFTPTDYLLQEKINGTEYLVDAASYQGKHIITAIGQYKKQCINGIFQCDYCDFIDEQSDIAADIHHYIINCLNTLGMQNGLSHIEIYHTSKGLYLVEINTRTSGVHGYINLMAKRHYQVDQFDAYHHLRNNKAINKISRSIFQRLYILKRLNQKKYQELDLTSIESLESYHSSIKLQNKQSHDHEGNVDLYDTKALIYLENTSRAQLESDTKIIENIEACGDCFK